MVQVTMWVYSLHLMVEDQPIAKHFALVEKLNGKVHCVYEYGTDGTGSKSGSSGTGGSSLFGGN